MYFSIQAKHKCYSAMQGGTADQRNMQLVDCTLSLCLSFSVSLSLSLSLRLSKTILSCLEQLDLEAGWDWMGVVISEQPSFKSTAGAVLIISGNS